jgi:UDP-2,3-diacylglucosamine hydrolase
MTLRVLAADTSASSAPPRIGLVAGWGRYPLVIAEALRSAGYEVVGLGIKDHADQNLRPLCAVYHEVGLAKLGAALRYFKRQGVTQATMAGKIHKVVLFQRMAWLKHLPDWRCAQAFAPSWLWKTRDRRDDTLLGIVVEEFARDGIHFAPATDFAPELLVKQGHLAGRRLTFAQGKDVEFGWRLAKEMGRLDVGQSVAVKGLAVIAVEAIEGTDQCIRRAGELCPQGGFTVVKVAKPQQDMRFDVPTIGLGTLETMVAAGAKVLAVEAEKTILIDEPDVRAFAQKHGLSLVSLRDGQAADVADAA